MKTAEIANQLVDLCRKGENAVVKEKFYSPDIVSVEAMDTPAGPRESRGIAAVKKKGEWWINAHTVHKASVDGPYMAADKFSVIFDYDITVKATGQRVQMKEVAVYTVDNGKIVLEEFLYAM
jgi:hypothetical protein